MVSLVWCDCNEIWNMPVWTPLHRHTKVAEVIISHGADLELCNFSGWTPLHVAAGNAHAWALRLLIEAGADVNRRDLDGDTPLHVVVGESNCSRCEDDGDGGDMRESIRLLAWNSGGLDIRNHEQLTPLHMAAIEGALVVVHWLLEAGAVCDGTAPTVLSVAREDRRPDIECLLATVQAVPPTPSLVLQQRGRSRAGRTSGGTNTPFAEFVATTHMAKAGHNIRKPPPNGAADTALGDPVGQLPYGHPITCSTVPCRQGGMLWLTIPAGLKSGQKTIMPYLSPQRDQTVRVMAVNSSGTEYFLWKLGRASQLVGMQLFAPVVALELFRDNIPAFEATVARTVFLARRACQQGAHTILPVAVPACSRTIESDSAELDAEARERTRNDMRMKKEVVAAVLQRAIESPQWRTATGTLMALSEVWERSGVAVTDKLDNLVRAMPQCAIIVWHCHDSERYVSRLRFLHVHFFYIRYYQLHSSCRLGFAQPIAFQATTCVPFAHFCTQNN
eukprot:m.532643 g.532643  ORF g.532643 m.532643 type:complete len:504 (+) comp22048_c0_seq3:1255-2766(+)